MTASATVAEPGEALALVRLLQLASPALPIGAYSYSQGLEWVVESGEVRDHAGVLRWIGDVFALSFARCELPVLARLLAAGRAGDHASVRRWNGWFRASRDSAELLAETLQMGGSLARLLGDLDLVDAPARAQVESLRPVTLPAAYALAAARLGIADGAAVAAYAWSWLENQVLAAVKLVPLGQVAGQRLLLTLAAGVPAAVETALALGDDELGNFAPGLALASCRHETQYTRLFRS